MNGAGVENVGDCRYDLPAWVNYLQQNRGCQRIALVGHSLGAIKSIFSESVRPLPAVAAVIAISATRLNHHQFLQCSAREAFVASYSIAEKMVEAGRRSELFHFEFPFPTWMSAESYMEKYGPRNEFDWTLFIEQTTKPTLMTFGERELNEHPAFEGVEEITLRLASQHDRIQFEKVDNADHFYVACFEELWGRIEPWIGKLDEEQK
jgi:pimeloyl-ACP methyl ester carboxylesterase